MGQRAGNGAAAIVLATRDVVTFTATLVLVKVLVMAGADGFGATIENAAMIIVVRAGRAARIIVTLIAIQAVVVDGHTQSNPIGRVRDIVPGVPEAIAGIGVVTGGRTGPLVAGTFSEADCIVQNGATSCRIAMIQCIELIINSAVGVTASTCVTIFTISLVICINGSSCILGVHEMGRGGRRITVTLITGGSCGNQDL